MDSIDQKSKNRTAVPPQIDQQRDKEYPEVITEKEQRGKLSVEKQQEESEEEIGQKGEGKQITMKNQRGKYRQYEDSKVIIEKIRSYRTQRYPDCEIMKFLDDMPRRTYYNYVKKLQEQEKHIVEQWISKNIEHFAEELMIYRETLCQKLREVQGIIDDKNSAKREDASYRTIPYDI
jgi:hypothetical protein